MQEPIFHTFLKRKIPQKIFPRKCRNYLWKKILNFVNPINSEENSAARDCPRGKMYKNRHPVASVKRGKFSHFNLFGFLPPPKILLCFLHKNIPICGNIGKKLNVPNSMGMGTM
jgi:hypothetical protein